MSTALGHRTAGLLPRLLYRSTFTTFCGLACGFWAQPGLHTVTGMLIGARLQQVWHHSRAHRFFAAARWSADQLGLVLLDLICALLVADGAPLRLVTDDTLARRAGRKVFGAAWHHDPPLGGTGSPGPTTGWCWGAGVLVDLPMLPTGRSACPSWRACGDPSTLRGGWTRPQNSSRWSAATSAPAASTWSPTAPTPAANCASCPPRSPSAAGSAPTLACTGWHHPAAPAPVADPAPATGSPS